MFTVMVVHNKDYIREEIKNLGIWGVKTGFIIMEEAKDGKEALTKLESKTVDLVVTDIKLSQIDGIELLKRIMEFKLCPCVVLLSSKNSFKYIRQGFVLGAFDYLRLPIVREEFVSLLIRAKRFIQDKKSEQNRIKKLEEKLSERDETYFPKADLYKIIEFITKGDIKALEIGKRIIEVTSIHFNYDLVKIARNTENILHEIFRILLERYQWLGKFIDVPELDNSDFFSCKSVDSIVGMFTSIIYKLNYIMGVFQCDKFDEEIIEKTCRYILDNVDKEISLKIISENLYMNRTYISEVFKKKTGNSFIEYVKLVKIERAKMLLSGGNLKIYEIAEKMGYKDIEYFSKLFKKHTNLSPIKYRQITTK
jgi:two-component system response regulator YesN